MKKIAILLIFIFAVASMTSCKSSKGCGLTGFVDSINLDQIENTFTAGIYIA